MNSTMQKEFMYLFERIGEPLYFGPKGDGEHLTFYNVPLMDSCENTKHASMAIKQNFTNIQRSVRVDRPTKMPDLTNVSRCCPKSAIYSYFNPLHREATKELRSIFMSQGNTKDLMSMACVCRDNAMVNPKVWLNAFAGSLLARSDTKGFRMPAFWEVMPDEFVNASSIRQAQRLAVMPPEDRPVLVIDQSFTGRDNNLENKLSYFREDMAINSHHWHWHLIYRQDEVKGARDRKGELFYYMHHAMLARYEAERLANGLPRTKVLNLDEPIREAYFPKLTDTNSGQQWGNRQEGTKLTDVDRTDDPAGLPVTKISLVDLKKYRDRIAEAIDSGNVLNADGKFSKLNIDMLGDMVESSGLNPNPQFYGGFGFHDRGHVLIAFAHDPRSKYREQGGCMSDTTTAMRDPAFYRWHTYVDEIFDSYKQTLQPYQDVGGDFPLKWDKIEIAGIEVKTKGRDDRPNIMTTFWMQSDVDLSRGLDFGRNNANNLGPIWARKTHLNHDQFAYKIKAKNKTTSSQKTTVRIFMAPRFNENGERFEMAQQRKLFFEMDKFTTELRIGDSDVTRQSTESSITIPWEQTFRELERATNPTPEQSVCGCGWPQHMLVPKGTPNGMIFDVVVFFTNGRDDAVPQKTNRPTCRESMSFCGILDDLYPDKKPMGYPFDRNPYTVPGTMSGMQVPVRFLDEYISRVPNMSTTQVRVIHFPSRMEMRAGGAPANTRIVMGDGSIARNPEMSCPPKKPSAPKNVPRNQPTTTNGRNPLPSRGASSSPETPGGWTHLDNSNSDSSSSSWDRGHSGGYYG